MWGINTKQSCLGVSGWKRLQKLRFADKQGCWTTWGMCRASCWNNRTCSYRLPWDIYSSATYSSDEGELRHKMDGGSATLHQEKPCDDRDRGPQVYLQSPVKQKTGDGFRNKEGKGRWFHPWERGEEQGDFASISSKSWLTHVTLRPGTLHRVRDAEESEEDADCNKEGPAYGPKEEMAWGSATCLGWRVQDTWGSGLPSWPGGGCKAENSHGQWSGSTPHVTLTQSLSLYVFHTWLLLHLTLHWDSLWKILGGSPT